MRVEQIGSATLYLGDCMKLMATMPDKSIDLAIVDPPYGGGNHHQNNKQIKGTKGYSYGSSEKMKRWDIAPEPEYFNELFRVSKHQIIFGGNYFNLPLSRNFIIYHKSNIPEGFNMAQCEYAWTNIKGNSKIYSYHAKPNIGRFHPCQKPVELYKFLLGKYAKSGDKIIDTHLGSGSIAVACNELGFNLIAIEIEKDYFKAACKRIKETIKHYEKT
jgi:site-specific DNA-methyltransferase (adenine-specific)